MTDDLNRSADQAGAANQGHDFDVTAAHLDPVRNTMTDAFQCLQYLLGEEPDDGGEFDFRVLGCLVVLFGPSVNQGIQVSRIAAGRAGLERLSRRESFDGLVSRLWVDPEESLAWAQDLVLFCSVISALAERLEAEPNARPVVVSDAVPHRSGDRDRYDVFRQDRERERRFLLWLELSNPV